jgi:hypothetical protein
MQVQSKINYILRQTATLYIFMLHPCHYMFQCECAGNHYIIHSHRGYIHTTTEIMESLQAFTVSIYGIIL